MSKENPNLPEHSPYYNDPNDPFIFRINLAPFDYLIESLRESTRSLNAFITYIAPISDDAPVCDDGNSIEFGSPEWTLSFSDPELTARLRRELERQKRLAPPDDSWWLGTPELVERFAYQEATMKKIAGFFIAIARRISAIIIRPIRKFKESYHASDR